MMVKVNSFDDAVGSRRLNYVGFEVLMVVTESCIFWDGKILPHYTVSHSRR
jgi:hypothetical protein